MLELVNANNVEFRAISHAVNAAVSWAEVDSPEEARERSDRFLE
ncbi:hypothetical protein [Alcanivorax sp. 24]|nr:hypothetical protein [Alcanivorax sp. 24]